jgi:hypothetical protein
VREVNLLVGRAKNHQTGKTVYGLQAPYRGVLFAASENSLTRYCLDVGLKALP